MIMNFRIFVLCCGILFGVMMGVGQAGTLSDAQALSGLHAAKAVFLVNVKNPDALYHVVKVIELTRKQLEQQKVAPHFIVVFIGPDVAFLTKDRRGIPYTDERAVAGIQHEIERFARKGIQFQACGVALKGMDIHPSMLISTVQPVESGFISVIAYQEKGYALVPVY